MSEIIYNAVDLAIVRYHDFIVYQTCNNLPYPDEFNYEGVDYCIKDIYDRFSQLTDSEIKEYRRVNTNHRRRKERFFIKIYGLFKHFDCYFITLTFADDVLEKTSKKTIRKYVTRYLKACSDLYLGNIDYGKENGREHYHAIVATNKSKYELPIWSHGFYLILPCKNNQTSIYCLTNYVLKLTNHALKTSTKQERIIYPRKKTD